MKKDSFLITCLIIFLAVSCIDNNSYKNTLSFSYSDLSDPILLEGAEIQFDKLLMRPVNIRFIDSLLVMRNRGTEYQFHIFNPQNSEKISELIPYGNGPSEMIEPTILPSNDSFIWILDKAKRSVSKCTFNILRDTSYVDILENINIQEYIDQAAMLNEGIISVVLNPEMERFCLFNNSGNLVKDFGEYPESQLDYTGYEKMEAFFCEFTVNYDKNRLFTSYKQTDLIEIYNLEGHLIKRIHGPECFFPFVKQEQNGEYIKVRPQAGKSRNAYFIPRDAGDEVFVLFSGKVFDRNQLSFLINNIFVFDWDGNPKRRYVLDKPLYSFDVDPQNKIIYGLSDDPDFHVVKFEY